MGGAVSVLEEFKARVQAAQNAARSDERSVELIISSIAAAEASLRISQREEKVAVRDAAHSAWHSQKGGATFSILEGGKGRSQTQIEIINAACSRVALTR